MPRSRAWSAPNGYVALVMRATLALVMRATLALVMRATLALQQPLRAVSPLRARCVVSGCCAAHLALCATLRV